MLAAIQAERAIEGQPCDKIQMVTHSIGASQAMISAVEVPDFTDFVSNVINLSPCPIPNVDGFTDPSQTNAPPPGPVLRRLAANDMDIALDGSERRGRSLKKDRSQARRLSSSSDSDSSKSSDKPEWKRKKSDKSNWTPEDYANFVQSKIDLHNRLRELRDTLDYQSYKEFYYCFKDWRYSFGKAYKYNYSWQEGIDECLCGVAVEDPVCQPEIQLGWSNFLAAMDKLDIYSLYGPDHDAQVDAICGEYGEDSDLCVYFRNVDATYPEGRTEISVRMLDHIVQQAFAGDFSRYNEDWTTNGWYTTTPAYDVTTINVPTQQQYVELDDVCDELVNQSLNDLIPTQDRKVTWTDGLRTHFSLIGDDDEAAYLQLYSQTIGVEACPIPDEEF